MYRSGPIFTTPFVPFDTAHPERIATRAMAAMVRIVFETGLLLDDATLHHRFSCSNILTSLKVQIGIEAFNGGLVGRTIGRACQTSWAGAHTGRRQANSTRGCWKAVACIGQHCTRLACRAVHPQAHMAGRGIRRAGIPSRARLGRDSSGRAGRGLLGPNPRAGAHGAVCDFRRAGSGWQIGRQSLALFHAQPQQRDRISFRRFAVCGA
ncbi:hypothetical protein D3C71_1475560 [compost metagenome]